MSMMSTANLARNALPQAQKIALAVLALGILVLYIPSYIGLANGTWTDSEEMHGPIVLAVAGWAFWNLRFKLLETHAQPSSSVFAWLFIALGLLALFVGRTLDILVLEIGSQILVVAGSALLLGGFSALRLSIFPLIFLFFMVPLPGNLIDSMTGSLKQVVSVVAENLLYTAGYPIARSGVILTVGQYQLLVADACSGLKSMFSLSAIGFLYIYLVEHKSLPKNLLLASALLPIAFVANVIRVIVLILVTYYFGDAAGQGFVHDFAGIVLFVLSILLLAGFDKLLSFIAMVFNAIRTRRTAVL
jgi:exosortase B